MIPTLDLILGQDKRNPYEGSEEQAEKSKDYRWLTWAAAPLQFAVVIWSVWVVSHIPLTVVEIIGFTLSVGITGGVQGINISHELVHRHNRLENFLGQLMLWTVSYMHWGIEHVAGHHRNVATPEDPATSRNGENFYCFFPRTVIGSFKAHGRSNKRG